MIAEIIEPNPILVEYIQISNLLWTHFDDKIFQINNGEWYYIMSKIEQNIFLLKRLDDMGLLQKEVNICDAGIGLGSALFDLYLQSKEIKNKKITFSGIEKNQRYINFFNDKLSIFWNNDLNYIIGDIMDQDYSEFNLIYSYSPFTKSKKLLEYYTKLKNDIKPGSLIIENRERGLGLDSTLSMVEGLNCIKVDNIYVFRKE
jgi:hypothetical protein